MTRSAAPPTIARTRWVETSEKCKCPACGHARLCSVSEDGAYAICRRGVESRRPVKQKDGQQAYLHVVRECAGPSPAAGSIGKAKKKAPKLTPPELKNLIKQHQSALSPDRLKRYADRLGVSERALKEFGIGFDWVSHAASFPMYGGDLKPVGIRLRTDEGRKLCVPGTCNGLFIPQRIMSEGLFALPEGLCNDRSPLLLLLPEGPTDSAAAFDLGFRAIGRPSNSGGAHEVCRLLSAAPKQDVVILADRDATKYMSDGTPFWPGLEGALALADLISPVCAALRVVKPPNNAKDIRKWFNDGGRPDVLYQIIASAERVTPAWMADQRRNLSDCKRRLKRKKAG
jgi:hypothetical protein